HCSKHLGAGSIPTTDCNISTRKVTAKDTTLTVVVVQLFAQYSPRSPWTARSQVEFCRHQHSKWRRCEVNPDGCPVRSGEGGPESARRIHTHPRNWRFDADVNHHQRRCKRSSVTIELRYVGHAKYHRH